MTDLAKIRAALQSIIDVIDAAPEHEPAPAHGETPPAHPVPEPGHDSAPEPDHGGTPAPHPAPDPTPVPTPPIIGNTVATSASDLRTKIDALKGTSGDRTIGIKDGKHGKVDIVGVNLGGRLTVIAENRRKAVFEQVNVVRSQDVILIGLASCPNGNVSPNGPVKGLFGINSDAASSRIEVADAFCMAHPDSANHANWTLAEWQSRCYGGIHLRSPDSLIRDSHAMGVQFGFSLTGDRSAMKRAYVVGASGDGFRLTADGLTGEDLFITDAIYMEDENHPDALQAYKYIGVGVDPRGVYGLTLRRVGGIEWTIRADNPLRWNKKQQRWGIMQGLGLHALDYRDLDIEDVWIKTAVPNGINIGGVTNLRGRRWTVLHGDFSSASGGFDTRNPKIRGNASGVVDVDDTLAETYAVSYAITNRKDAGVADYAAPEPAWIAPIRALAQ